MSERCLSVFIVDDEISVVEWLVKNVEWEVYNCKVAGYSQNALGAMEYLEEHHIDLLLTDISMPQLSGLDLIKRVKRKNPDIFIVVISAYDKFAYVKEALQYGIINYCLKPIDINELHDCLKIAEAAHSERIINSRNQDMLVFRNSIFQRLIMGESNAFRLHEQCELAGIDLDVSICQIVVVDIKRVERFHCFSIINQFNSKEENGWNCFFDSHMNLVFLFMGEKGYDKKAEEEIKEVFRHEGILYDIVWAIGEPLENYRKLAESYHYCCDFLNADFLFPDREIRTERYSYKKYLEAGTFKEQQLLLNGVKSGDIKYVIGLIKEVMNRVSAEEKRTEIVCLAVFLTKSIRQLYPYRNAFAPSKIWLEQLSLEKAFDWIENYLAKTIDDNQDDHRVFHPYVKNALQKVDSCYGDNALSLQEIAKECNISAAYLGKLFKEQTGEYFNDYLLKARLKASEILLLENKLRMGEIAENVGFANQSYFNKMFRRSYGTSPAEYRRIRNAKRDKQ